MASAPGSTSGLGLPGATAPPQSSFSSAGGGRRAGVWGSSQQDELTQVQCLASEAISLPQLGAHCAHTGSGGVIHSGSHGQLRPMFLLLF